MTANPWLAGIPKADPSMRLFMFPHAGGAASAYASWLERGGGELEIRSVQYPGRETRRRERAARRIDELADGLARAVAAEPTDVPYAFFGHSMGALVAFEVARRLRDLGGQGPERLIAAASAAPQTPRREDAAMLSDEQLIAWLAAGGEAAAEALAHPELAALVLPGVRADLTAVANYRMVPGPPLDCPITVLTGTEDEVHGYAVTGWKEHTHSEFRHHEFPGGHFFPRSSDAELFTFTRGLLVSAEQ